MSLGHGIKHLFTSSAQVLIPFIKETLALTGLQIGTLAAIQSISSGLINIPAGILSDVFRPKAGVIIATSALLLGIGYLLLSLLSIENWFLVGMIAFIFLGVGANLWHPPAFAVLSDNYPDKKAFALGVHLSAASAGNTLGPVLIGLLLGGIAISGLHFSGFNWKTLSFFIFILCMILSLSIFFFNNKVSGSKGQKLEIGSYFLKAFQSIKRIEVLTMVLLHGLRSSVHMGFTVYLLIYLKEYLYLSPVSIGLHFSLIGLSGVLFTPIWGLFSDRIGRLPVITLGMMLTALFIFLIKFGSSGWTLILLLLLLGCVLFAIIPVISAAAMDFTVKGTEGTSVSLLFAGGAILGSLSPVLAGYLYDNWGFDSVLIFTSIMALLGTMVSAFAWIKFK